MDAPLDGLTVRDALRWSLRVLVSSGLDSPRLDAEILLADALGLSRTQLLVHAQESIDASAARRFTDLVKQRARHEPVAYLIGRRAFYDVELHVGTGALIPRPETEHLVEEALTWARAQGARPLKVVDVGTGSGALAVVLARHLPQARVWGIDISSDALRVAAHNVAQFDLGRRSLLVQGDLLNPFVTEFDLIVANLPYVRSDALPSLARDVVAFEPHLALDGGEDGLATIRRLLPQIAARMSATSLLLLEIDEGQGTTVVEMLHRHVPDARVAVLRDYAGFERVVRAERAQPHA